MDDRRLLYEEELYIVHKTKKPGCGGGVDIVSFFRYDLNPLHGLKHLYKLLPCLQQGVRIREGFSEVGGILALRGHTIG